MKKLLIIIALLFVGCSGTKESNEWLFVRNNNDTITFKAFYYDYDNNTRTLVYDEVFPYSERNPYNGYFIFLSMNKNLFNGMYDKGLSMLSDRDASFYFNFCFDRFNSLNQHKSYDKIDNVFDSMVLHFNVSKFGRIYANETMFAFNDFLEFVSFMDKVCSVKDEDSEKCDECHSKTVEKTN